jgi:hypothetical protein
VPKPISVLDPSALITSRYLRGGYYGETGAGKTTLLASAGARAKRLVAQGKWPEGVPYLWVISAYPENIKPLLPFEPYIKVSQLTEWDQLHEVLQICQSALLLPGGVPNPAAQQPGRFFRALAFDTWTRFVAFAIRQQTGFKVPPPGEEGAFLSQAPKTPQGFAAWQNVGSLSNIWMEFFCRLPMHVCFTFQEDTRRPEFEHDPVVTGPALTPFALRGAKENLEMIGRLFAEDVSGSSGVAVPDPSLRRVNLQAVTQHYMLLGQHHRYIAKGPTHALGYVLAAPTWEKLEESVFAPPPVEIEEEVRTLTTPNLLQPINPALLTDAHAN